MASPKNPCTGCKLLDPDEVKCYVSSLFLTNDNKVCNCPCINCLVKAMCTEVCADYKHYVHDYCIKAFGTLNNMIKINERKETNARTSSCL